MHRRIFLLACLLLLGCGPQTPPRSGPIDAAELAGRLDGPDAPLILDVRTPGEFSAGHIPGALNIPHDELAERLAELDGSRQREIVVHCKSGRRASLAEELLASAGFENLRDLNGHMQAWEAAQLPVERTADTP